MKVQIYQVDAFSDRAFGGNPAAVIALEQWLPEAVLQNIAAENNLSETAFYLPHSESDFHIRWFTPTTEVDLCGHATLATAHVLFQHKNYLGENVSFFSKSGILNVTKVNGGYEMNFPSDEIQPISPPPELINGLGISPQEVYRGRDDYLAIVPFQSEIESLRPNFRELTKLPARGVIVSSKGNDEDFVSRCFYPQAGINEDPATGSAHTTLAPYWSKRLNKQYLRAAQLSKRKGILSCQYLGERVLIGGAARTYLQGEIYI